LKKDLLTLIHCPQCQHSLIEDTEGLLQCDNCGKKIGLVNGIPVFTDVPSTIEPWQKIERGPHQGTAWRRANWKFLDSFVALLSPDSVILDVGAGHGDFADIFTGRNYFSLDIVPYPEVDLVADLSQVNPFNENSFDVIIFMNVLEHVFESRELLKTVGKNLKPGGKIVITVPFLLKVHQAPFDFVRYTPFALEKMATGAGLTVETLEGYYDPLYLLNESLGNVWQFSLSNQSTAKQWIAKSLIFIIQRLINGLGHFIQSGHISTVLSQQNPAPVGYLVVLRK
jgi:SAM-dependent methyltransferase